MASNIYRRLKRKRIKAIDSIFCALPTNTPTNSKTLFICHITWGTRVKLEKPSELKMGLSWVPCKLSVITRERDSVGGSAVLSVTQFASGGLDYGKGRGNRNMGTLQEAGKARMSLAIPRMVCSLSISIFTQ